MNNVMIKIYKLRSELPPFKKGDIITEYKLLNHIYDINDKKFIPIGNITDDDYDNVIKNKDLLISFGKFAKNYHSHPRVDVAFEKFKNLFI